MFQIVAMHKVDHDELVTLLAVALRTAPAHIKQRLRSKLPHEVDAACDSLAKLMAQRVDNQSYMVIATELVPMDHSGKHMGRWGIDEPDPTLEKLVVIGALDGTLQP